MAAASGGFGLNIKDIFDNIIAMDWPTDSWKVALFTSTPTPNYDTDTAYNAGNWLVANEITGTGYTAAGNALSTPTLTIASPVATQLKFDANDTAWTVATFSGVASALIYDTSISNKGLFGISLGGSFAVTGGTFTLVYNANGIAFLDYA